MDLSAVFFLLAVLVLIGMFLYAPFVSPVRQASQPEEHELSALMAERDRVIRSLQELDFDHALGKIPAEDYPAQRADLVRKGATILRKLDDMQPAAVPGPAAEARLEEAIAAERADGGQGVADASVQLTDDEIESLIAARRRQRRARSAGFCPRCGRAVLMHDRFCSSCGKSLA